MNDTSTSDPLLWEALPDLTLTIAQTSALCSISVRQLGYWTHQGYVTASGQGTRRTYGMDSIKRILAIRRAMAAGASLRQSLRQVSVEVPAVTTPVAVVLDGSTLGLDAVLSRSLTVFFNANPCTRDHAGGLAVKLGFAEVDVRAAAERLCKSGFLAQTDSAGVPVFHSAAWGNSHA